MSTALLPTTPLSHYEVLRKIQDFSCKVKKPAPIFYLPNYLVVYTKFLSYLNEFQGIGAARLASQITLGDNELITRLNCTG